MEKANSMIRWSRYGRPVFQAEGRRRPILHLEQRDQQEFEFRVAHGVDDVLELLEVARDDRLHREIGDPAPVQQFREAIQRAAQIVIKKGL